MLLLPRPRSSMNTVRPSTSTFAEKNKNRVRPLTSYPETHVLERACTELNSHVRREMKNNISSEKSEKMRLLKLMRLDSFIIKKGKKERILDYFYPYILIIVTHFTVKFPSSPIDIFRHHNISVKLSSYLFSQFFSRS